MSNDVPEMVKEFLLERWNVTLNQLITVKYKGQTYYMVPDASRKPQMSIPAKTKLADKMERNAHNAGIKFSATERRNRNAVKKSREFSASKPTQN